MYFCKRISPQFQENAKWKKTISLLIMQHECILLQIRYKYVYNYKLTNTSSQYPTVSKTMYPNFPENAKWKKYDNTTSHATCV